MPTINHSRYPQWIDPDNHHIGAPLTSDTMWKLWQNYLYLNHWQMQGSLFQASFPPDNTVGTGTANNDDVVFFPIMWAPPREDGEDRQFGIRIMRYPEYITGLSAGQQLVKVYDDFPAISLGSAVYFIPGMATSRTAVYGDMAVSSWPIEIYDGCDYTPDASGGFKAIGVQVQELCIAGISLFEMPTRKLSATNARGKDSEFQTGAVIRGYDSTAEPSLGHLRHWIGDGSDGEDWIERNTRRCYFQTGHHTGIWYNGTSSKSLFEGSSSPIEYKPKIKARNLLQKTSGSLKALPALVVSRPSSTDSTGCTVTLTSGATADTWTYTFTGSELQTGPGDSDGWATLVVPGDGSTGDLDVFNLASDEYDEISVDVQCASGKEMVVHTVSLWEDGQW